MEKIMDLTDFIQKTELVCKTELERIKLLAYYGELVKNEKEFDLNQLLEVLDNIGAGISNKSRIKNRIKQSRDFRKNNKSGRYILNPIISKSIAEKYKDSLNDTESIESNSELVDEAKFLGKRGYLDKLVKQANNCYRNNCYDACAVIIRRIFEISLILAYRYHNIENEIQDAQGHTYMLEKIVANAVSNNTLKLSKRKLTEEYEKIRNLGNFAAHKVEYNTSFNDIEQVKDIFRVRLEELYYKANLL